MFGNPAAERRAIESTYEDTVTIARPGKKTEGSITHLEDIPVYVDLPCALSRNSDSSAQTKAQQNIDYDAVVFMAPELQVLPGDTAVVKRFGRDNPTSTIIETFEVIGRPSIFATHQEVKVKDSDLA